MRIALIADTFPPMQTSGAVQLRDLSREFVRQGHAITVLLPSPDQEALWSLEEFDGVELLRLKAPRTKDISYFRRTLSECIMPFAMLRQLRKSPLARETWDGIVWYSPSIFHGPLAKALKIRSNCRGYLIIRDLFPEWAVDVGLIGRGLPYIFFKTVANYQYAAADIIGVQSQGNLGYFKDWQQLPGRKLEVLQNWLSKPAQARCTIRVNSTALAERKVFVYAGNMGVAQGMNILLDLAENLKHRTDVGFLFVGRGRDNISLKDLTKDRKLDNVLFYDEINPDEIPDLYSQCSAGIVVLDSKHKSHNIPGKFLTYMQNGLPVLANVNAGNDLAQMIRDAQVGQVSETNEVSDLIQLTEKLLSQIDLEAYDLSNRCRKLFEQKFAVDKTVRQIIAAFKD